MTKCGQVWRDAMVYCSKVVGEDDHKYIEEFEGPAQLMAEISALEKEYPGDRTIPRKLGRILPRLETFMTMLDPVITPGSIRIACVWGAVSLLVKLAGKLLGEIVSLLWDVRKSLELLEIHRKSIQLDPRLLEELFNVPVDLLSCSAFAIRHLRKNNIQPTTTVTSWNTVRAKISTMVDDISHMGRLTRKAELYSWLESRPAAQIPCHVLPFARNPRFYERPEILRQITDKLAVQKGISRVRSVAIWGTGGIGKTQIALEYAYRQIDAGLPIVLWFTSGEEVNEFNKAAPKLQLKTTPLNSPSQNRDLVLDYLQRTDQKWLLVFDDVENPANVLKCFPNTGKGDIILTCRSKSSVTSFVRELIEVPMFAKEEGGGFILSTAGQRRITNRDVEVVEELSEQLGGFALALESVGRQIEDCGTVKHFLEHYDGNHLSLDKQSPDQTNPYYTKDLKTVWEGSFKKLSQDSCRLLMLLSLVAPPGVQESMFTNKMKLPQTYAFLTDGKKFHSAMSGLTNLCLVSQDQKSSVISVHQLIQEAYLHHISPTNLHEAFKILIGLLRIPFLRPAGWKTCSGLIRHVQALGDKYNQLGTTKFYPPSEDLTYLLTDAAWYLQETGAFKAGENLIKTAFSNCVDRGSLEYAYLITTAGTISECQGHGKAALAFYQDALKIHIAQSPSSSVEVANAYSAVGLAFTSLWQASEGIKYANYAIENTPADHGEKAKRNQDQYLRNRARAYFIDNQFEKSKADLKEAAHWQSLIHGVDSRYHGESAYMLGKIAARQNDPDEAHAQFERAIKLLSIGNPTHASVASAKFQKGCVHLHQEEYTKALQLFGDALSICQMNETGKGTEADSARVKWRMSQAMAHEGKAVEAETLRAAAEKTKKTLFATDQYPQGEGEEREYDSLVGLLYR